MREIFKAYFSINFLLYYEHKNYQRIITGNKMEILGALTTL